MKKIHDIGSYSPLDKKFIGTLLFSAYPITTVYSNKKGNPVIKEWVDCNKNGTVDRYFIYELDPSVLLFFLRGEISHKDLFLSAKNNLGFIFEKNRDEEKKYLITSPQDLPEDYLPEYDTYVNPDDIVDYDKIYQYFNLDIYEDKDYNNYYHKSISSKYNAETFNIHFKTGSGIKHGTIDTELLGITTLEFDNLYKELVFDTFLGKDRGSLNTKSKSNQELVEFSKTEIYNNIAASYSIFIRPKYSHATLFDKETFTESVANKLFNLIEESLDSEKLADTYSRYSEFVISSYLNLMAHVKEKNLNMDFAWYKPTNKAYKKNKVNSRTAYQAVSNINNLSTTEKDQFDVTGKFTALNCNTGHFAFESVNEEEFSGYLEKRIRDSAVSLNFKDFYKITIDRAIEKEPGKADPKITDTIISHYKMDRK